MLVPVQEVYAAYIVSIFISGIAKIPSTAYNNYLDPYDNDELIYSEPVDLPLLFKISFAVTPTLSLVRAVLRYLILFHLLSGIKFIIIWMVSSNSCSELAARMSLSPHLTPVYPPAPKYNEFVLAQATVMALLLIPHIVIRAV